MKTTTLALFLSLLLRHATAADPDYCTAHPKHATHPNPDAHFLAPLPCPGEYAAVRGVCCAGKFDWAAARCHGHEHTPVWALPLAPCVSQNPNWSRCPGNMMDGLCCSGAEIVGARVERGKPRPAECQGGGTAVFTVSTLPGGTASTTVSLPPGMTNVPTDLIAVGAIVKPNGETINFALGDLESGHPTASATTVPGGALVTATAPSGGSAAPAKEEKKKAGSAGMRADGGMVLMSVLAVAWTVLTVFLL
jgi:hypothetical protein